jgi:quercetin dioxygenase-like cupin family protein
MIMSVLGGNDSGGGVIWAPQVLDAAKAHGLILSETGLLYDTKKGQHLPVGEKPMTKLTKKELQEIPEVPVHYVVRDYVARYLDLMALSKNEPCLVIGEKGLLKDKPGFEIEFISSKSLTIKPYSNNRFEILMPIKGEWNLTWKSGETILNPGDTCLLKPNFEHSLIAVDSSESSLYRVTNTEDPAGPTWRN